MSLSGSFFVPANEPFSTTVRGENEKLVRPEQKSQAILQPVDDASSLTSSSFSFSRLKVRRSRYPLVEGVEAR